MSSDEKLFLCRHSCGCSGYKDPKRVKIRSVHEKSIRIHWECDSSCLIHKMNLSHMNSFLDSIKSKQNFTEKIKKEEIEKIVDTFFGEAIKS
jgi:hypothetical protein